MTETTDEIENFEASIAASLHSNLTLHITVGNVLSREEHILIGTGAYMAPAKYEITYSPETGIVMAQLLEFNPAVSTELQPVAHFKAHDAKTMVMELLRHHLAEDEVEAVPQKKIRVILIMFNMFQEMAKERVFTKTI